MSIKKIIIALVIIFAAGYFSIDPIVKHTDLPDRLITAAGSSMLTPRHPELFETDALRVFVCGSSAPQARPDRAKACIGIIAEGDIYLFDVGPGSWKNIESWQMQTGRLAGIFITHFHSDHIGDMGEANVQSWIMGRKTPLQVFGPQGIEKVVNHFNLAYEQDYHYRMITASPSILSHDAPVMQPRPFTADGPEKKVVYEKNGLVISAFPVNHQPVDPAVGYHVSYKGRSVVISGDTVKTDTLTTAATNADMLFHEAMSTRIIRAIEKSAKKAGDKRMEELLSKTDIYHTSPAAASEIAQTANVDTLVLYHLAPPPDNFLVRKMFLAEVADNTILAEDGQLYTLPANSTDIKKGKIE
ncbi:MAG: MBL fold metallo-hydrolase [Kordiimonas sp.]|nr:MBL fold metallo-hydrolase [Kordiimonas sp.]|tara:strand:- start:433 stop:1503 length:1071 start_codon:yes stop_codon:yes gene_type:complete